MCKKLCFLISFVLLVGLAAPAAADELLASYENSEMADLTITVDGLKDPGLTVTRVLGGTGGAPPATDGDYILKWVWIDEPPNPIKIEIWQEWETRRLDLAPYNVITADVWFDEPNAQPATIGIWSNQPAPFWAPALSVPIGLYQWHTVEMDISGIDYNDISYLLAFLFENLAGDSGVLYTDNMWLRFVRQVQALRPTPFDKAVSIDPDVDLSWEAGLDANSHDVYFGTDEDAVTNASVSNPMGVYKGNKALGDTSYDPGTLERLKTYYWRIDEVNEADPNVWKGDVWSFKTVPIKYFEIPLVSYEDSETHYEVWTGITISGDADATLVLGDKLVGGETWGTVTVPTASDGNNVLGLKWTNEQDLEVEHGCTFEGSSFTYDLDGIDEMVFDVYYAPNDTEGGFNPLPHNMGVFDWRFAPARTPSSNLPTTRGEWHTIVIDVSHLNNIDLDSIYDFEFTAHGEDFDPDGDDPNNWGALMFMDNLRLRYYLTEFARGPYPANGATDVDRDADLSWTPGLYAVSHDVYFGTTSPPPFIKNQTEMPYDPGTMALDTTYYWRIDEVNEADPNVWEGDVWSFTTVNYLVVDDFESYTTHMGGCPNPDNLLCTWDKLGDAYLYLRQSPDYPVHGGAKSMEFKHNNYDEFYSEACLTYKDANGPPQNWTDGGVKALDLWLYGKADNDANEQMYVKLESADTNSAKVPYDGDMNDIRIAEWQVWRIDLQEFSGVNLSQVKKVTIGFGDEVGPASVASVDVYFDDIRLYIPRCIPEYILGDFTGECTVDYEDLDIMTGDWLVSEYNVPAEPNSTDGLVALYEFATDANFNDTSGNGHDGDPNGDAATVYDAVRDSNVLSLDGDGDYVVITGSNTPGIAFDINDVITVACWIKVSAFDKYFNTIIAKGDDSWRLARASETETGNGVEFACTGISNNAYGSIGGSMNVNDDQWHHVAGVYDGSKICIYVDGILDNTEDASGSINSSDYNVLIGENEEAPGREWNGLIDELRIYNRALSHGEIVSLAGESSVTQPLPRPEIDLHKDGKVNLKDYAVLANSWLETILWP